MTQQVDEEKCSHSAYEGMLRYRYTIGCKKLFFSKASVETENWKARIRLCIFMRCNALLGTCGHATF
eukprot:1215887-Pleurochrysis_carterae.AAC.1